MSGETEREPCPHCGDAGAVFLHADNCDDNLCALNGDYHSCVGKVEPCPYCAATSRDGESK